MTQILHLRPTLAAVELDLNEPLEIVTPQGQSIRLVCTNTWVKVHSCNLQEPGKPELNGKTIYRCHAEITINDTPLALVRWFGNQRSFGEPYRLFGLEIWFDGLKSIGEILFDRHGAGGAVPKKTIRLAIQQEGQRICPVRLHPWCPLPADGIQIDRDCYNGSDCWLGAYQGTDVHTGLDINHPAGTPLTTPIAIDRHELFTSLANGDNNNRWRGFHT